MDRRSRLGLSAFVQLHRPDYLRYARARLYDESASEAAVEAAVAAFSGRWGDFLRNARPAADAWRQLRGQIRAASGAGTGHDPAVERLYEVLPEETADAALLRWRLSLAVESVADLMGTDRPAVTVSLLTARRRLSLTTLQQLEHHASRP
ncbi:hypothetical protein OG875_28350 [Streptomyces sp. NBC_01498]|uniref:hypothetical protein n=1 Tax=Streptomyces sp. NBC_01498 TaxID=2975870 RepID=UPI002E7AC891|nr:hypothetical protein [Streptomyces sp. NBC_01498]WTL28147.1 hypothetical protein OG875_28350 [Streptomyces sp. NBC_01498]